MKANLGLLILHFFLLAAVFYLLLVHHVLGDITADDLTLTAWDGAWYESIALRGYTYKPGEPSSVAFFALFPLLWRWLGADRLQIAAVNLILYSAGALLLAKKWRLQPAEWLLLLGTPVLFFCYVPYSEALFFLLSVVFLVGLKEQNSVLTLAGLFLVGMVRSVALVFFPVFLFLALMQPKEGAQRRNRTPGRLLLFSLVSVASLFVTFAVQKIQTGYWFLLFDAQKSWGRVFSMPRFPLWVHSLTNGFDLFWLDGSAFLMGILSVLLCLAWIVGKHLGRDVVKDDATLFSFAYLAMIFLVALFYSPSDDRGTRIFGLSRHFLCGPYYMLFVLYFLRRRFPLRFLYLQVFLLIVGVLCFAYPYTESPADVMLMVVPMFVYFWYILSGFQSLSRTWLATLPIYGCLGFMQVYLLVFFLQNHWVS